MDWQPIDTAPRDGSRIGMWIVHEGDDYCPEPFECFGVGYWREANLTSGFERDEGWEAEWIGTPSHWVLLEPPHLKTPSPASE